MLYSIILYNLNITASELVNMMSASATNETIISPFELIPGEDYGGQWTYFTSATWFNRSDRWNLALNPTYTT